MIARMAWIVENRGTQVVERRETPYLTDDMKIDLATTYFPRYPNKRAVLLPALHAVQHQHGWISTQAKTTGLRSVWFSAVSVLADDRRNRSA
jgi:NADH:ubiquinone oxidoreductase subunit E